MNNFDFPSNIKQMGSIEGGMRIYVEDYVYTYMQQYAEAGGYQERLGVLVGRHMTIDGMKILIISGILQAMDVKIEKGLTLFTESSWDNLRAEMRKYFKGYDVVGWMQSQPGGGTLLNPGYVRYHLNSFDKPWQVLFVIDPIEKMSAFFSVETSSGELKESGGYFIYYDKNQNMHEYMISNKIKGEKQKSEPVKQPKIEIIENPMSKETILPFGYASKTGELNEGEFAEAKWQKATFTKKLEPFKQKKPFDDQKKIVNMLVPFSAVLLLISFIMGAGLIQSDGRISFLEYELSVLSSAYHELSEQFSDIRTAAVFAVSEQSITEQGATELTSEASNYLSSVMDRVELTPVTVTNNEPPVIQASPEQTSTPEQESPAQTSEPEVRLTQNNIPETYIVQAGDTLGRISLMFYGNFNMMYQIMELNDITDPDSVIAGAVLRLP